MSIPPPQTSTFTRDLRHLFSSVSLKRAMQVPNAWQKALWKQEHIKVVPDKQRILKWNIVPGDIVRRVPNRFKPSDKPETYEVLSIDKWQNKVYLRGTKHADGNARSLPYSMCQLYLGDYYTSNKAKEREPIFAQRIGSTNLKYNWKTKRFEWIRYAEATTPRIHLSKQARVIPWPKELAPPIRANGNPFYDTEAADAHEMSWEPHLPGSKVPKYYENSYISDLYNNRDLPEEWQRSLPMEHLMARELMNPLSRARRQERWQEKKDLLERSKEEYITRELNNLGGRRKQDAKKEGVFRWKMEVRKYNARVNWQRWIKRGAKDKLEVRLKRRHRKTSRQLRKLKSLRLKDGQNQVIPSASSGIESAATA